MKANAVTEHVVQFGSVAPLVGVMTRPAGAFDGAPAVLLLNSGLLHRAGPNRMYVDLARRLAGAGLVTLRFDFSGIGDSGVRSEGLPFLESSVQEVSEAMDLVESSVGASRFILLGLCSGGTVAFRAAARDARVTGAVLINVSNHLHGDDPELGAYLRNRTLRHHYFRIATSASFAGKNWRKALTGHVDYIGLVRSVLGFRLRPKQGGDVFERELRRVEDRGVHLLHIYSEGDEGLDYAQGIFGGTLQRLGAGPRSRVDIISGANHTLTLRWAQEYVGDVVLEWIRTSHLNPEPVGRARADDPARQVG